MSKQSMAEKLKKFGKDGVAATGAFVRPVDVIPTGILALDLALGTGGWPSGSIIEIFGPPDAGKSVLGLYGITEAQKLGKLCGLVAAEPGYDSNWAAKHGVDLDRLIVSWPENGKEAFDHLQIMVEDDDIEFIVFDSLGALLRPSEAEIGGNPTAGGQAALITWGVKRAWMATWLRNKYVLFLNQIRDVMNSRYPMVDSPGGHALKHASEIRIHIRPNGDKKTLFTVKEGKKDIVVGQEIIAEIKRTKRDEGTGKEAKYNFFSMNTAGLVNEEGKPYNFPYGIDRISDIINTSKRTGVMTQGGAWIFYEDFPGGKLQGKEKVGEWLEANPKAVDAIRDKVVAAIR